MQGEINGGNYSWICFHNIINSQVIGIDIDPDAIEIAKENNEHFETNVEFINANIEKALNFGKEMPFDVIVMNPPFGTKKNVGVDARFVQIALQYAPVVYSLHKTSTRKVKLIL